MSLIQSILNFVPQLAGLAPATVALLGAFVITMTALQGLALAAQFLANAISKLVVPVPALSAFFASWASACGVVALDLQKFGALLSKATAFLSRFAKPAGDVAKKGIVWIVAVIALTGCSSFLHFSNPSTQAVTCEITAAVLPLLEDLSATLGVPLATVEDLYSDACTQAAAKGMGQADAESAGVNAARDGAPLALILMRAKGITCSGPGNNTCSVSP